MSSVLRPRALGLVAALAALSLGACELQPPPGSFSLEFHWDTPPETTVFLWARVEHRPVDPLAPGETLALAGPAKLEPGGAAELTLGDVPNGDDRVVVVEVRGGDEETLPVQYFGYSEPFSIEPGKQASVVVDLALQKPAEEIANRQIRLLFGDPPGPRAKVVLADAQAATVEVSASGGLDVLLANDEFFVAGYRKVAFDGSTEGTVCASEEVAAGREGGAPATVVTCSIPAWDLLEGQTPIDGKYPNRLYGVFAKVIDRYGYESEVFEATVALDTEGPQPVRASLSAPLARPGDPVVVSVITDEVLDAAASALVGKPADEATAPLAIGPAKQLGGKETSTSYTFTAKVPVDAVETSWKLEATLVDPLGNAAEPFVLRDDPAEGETSGPELVVTVDATPPALVLAPPPALSKNVFALDDDGATLAFDFALVEAHPADSLPEVRVDGKSIGAVTPLPALDDPAASIHGFRFEGAISVSAWPGVDREVPVEVSWTDAAGHKATSELPSRPRIDFRPPSASCKLSPEGRPAGVGEPVQLLVTADEPLAPGFPSVTSAASAGAIWVSPGEGSLTSVHVAGPFDPGTEIAGLPVEVTLADAAGNLADDVCPGLSFSVDTVPPEVLEGEVGPLLVKAGETVSISFSAPADVTGTPEVRVGELTAEPLGGPEPAWTYALLVPEDATSGLRAVRVTLADAAGNLVVDESLPPVAIDVDPPQLTCTSSVAEGAAVGFGQAVVVVVQSDEPLAGGAPVPAGISGLTFDPPQTSGLSTTFVALAGEPDVETSFSWAFTATDLVGNALVETACLGSGTVDTVFPEVVAATKPAATLLGPGGEVELAFTVSEALAQPPAVSAGGVPAVAEDAEGPDYLFRFAAGEEVPEGVHAVQIGMVDAAKNQAFDTKSFPALTVDASAPDLALLTVSPELAGAGGTLTAVLVASEPLAGPPPLFAKTAGGATLEFTPLTSGKGAASYTYAITLGDGAAGGVYGFDLVSLEDLAGNRADHPPLVTFEVDASAPVISALAVSPDRVGSSGTLAIDFQVSEPVPAPGVVVEVAGRPAACSGSETSWSCAYEVAGDEVPAGTEAALIVVARVADAAGNQGSASGTVVFDLEPPLLTCLASHGAGKPAKLGDVVTLTLTSAEALAGPGYPDVATEAKLTPATSGLVTTFTVPILAEWGETTWSFDVSATDLVGNVASPACELAPIQVDGVLPGVVPGSSSISPAFLASGAETTITFTTTEPLQAPPVFVGKFLAMPVSQDAETFTFSWEADPKLAPDGVHPVVTPLFDLAGNGSEVQLGLVTVDTTPPGLVVADVTPSSAKLGDTMTFLLSTDEALLELPAVVARPAAGGAPLVFAAVEGNPASAKIRYAAAVSESLPSGLWTFDPVTLVDLAGNSEEAAISATLTLDAGVPSIGPLAVSPERIDEDGLLTVTFEVDDPVTAGGVHVQVGTIPMGCSSPDGLSWSCEYAMLGTEIGQGEEAAKTVLAVVSDAAGNETSGSATVVVDFRDPGLTCAASHGPGNPAGLGDVVQVTVTADETLEPGTLEVATNAPGVTSKAAGLSTTFSATVPNVVTTWDFTFTARDLAGNEVTGACSEMEAIPVDGDAPSLESSSFSPASVAAGDVATISFSTSEEVATPKVTVGGALADLASHDGDAWVFTFTPNAGSQNGDRTVTIELTDLAGNESETSIGDLVVDTKPPSLVVSSVTPSQAALGDTVSLLLSTNEGMDLVPEVIARHEDGVTALAFALSDGAPGDLELVFAATIGDGLPEGVYTFDPVTLTDSLGNAAAVVVPASFSANPSVPVVSDVVVSPGRIGAEGTLTLTFWASEVVPLSGVEATVAGSAMLCAVGGSGFDWTCTHDVTGAETPAGTESTKPVLVTLSDAAGNEGSGSGTVTFDFAAPSILVASRSYTPDDANPLSKVTSATIGTEVEVRVTASEPLLEQLGDTTLRAVPVLGGTPFDFVTTDVFGSLAVFEYTVPEVGTPDGTYTLHVAWADPYGNVVSDADTGATLEIDATAGALTIDHDAAVFLRSPWGNQDEEEFPGGLVIPGGATFALTGSDPFSPDPMPDDTFLLPGNEDPTKVRVFAEKEKTTLLGTLSPGAGGWPRTVLAGVDTEALWITGVDGAGNETAPVRLRRVELVATPNTSKFHDPLELLGTDDQQEVLRGVKGHERELSRSAAAGLYNGGGGEVRRYVYWRDVPLTNPAHFPDAQLRGFATAWDAARGVLVVYGGTVGSTYRDTVLEFDGDRWTKVVRATDAAPGGNQAKGFRASMTWDAARGRVFLFGGEFEVQKKTTEYTTYEWDGTEWKFKNPPKPVPSKRISPALAWDGKRERVVLVGGGLEMSSWHLGTAALFGDAWSWNGSSWTQLPSGPSPRLDAAMAWDAARDRIVLFGGAVGLTIPDIISAASDETWEFDGTSWTQVIPTGVSPAPRSGAAMIYDPISERILLHGGTPNNSSSGAFSDLWSWDGATWIEEEASVPGETFIQGRGVMHWDTARGEALLLRRCTVASGCSQKTEFGELFSWDGSEFHRRHVAASTDFGEAREFAMTWDEDRDRLVSVGESSGAGNEGSDAVREFDGYEWQEKLPATPPTKRGNHAMVWDPETSRVWLYGGARTGDQLSDLWKSDPNGGNGSWTLVDADAPPGPLRDSTFVHDPDGGRLLLFGGFDETASGTNTLWSFDTTTETWSIVLTSGGPPPARGLHGAVWDPIRHRLVVWGGAPNVPGFIGTDPLGDLWELENDVWTQRFGFSPPATIGHTMVWDPITERSLVLGGTSGGPKAYVSGWNGTDWFHKDGCSGGCIADGLTARYHHVSLFAQDRLLVYGGEGTEGTMGDMEERVLSASSTPAAGLLVDGAAVGVDPATVQGLAVRSHCTAYPGKGAPPTELIGWAATGDTNPYGRWEVLDTVVPDGVSLLEWSAAGAEDARRFVLSRDAALAFQCRPGAPTPATSTGSPVVDLDYLEVRVQLLLP